MSKILICDDEPDIVNALKIYLESEGYETVSAENGKKALELLKQENVQLVLLDVMMPVMDGIETLSKLREASNVPVILLTAKSEDTDKILGLSSGADDYITKPFNPMELLARVKSCLQRYLMLGGSKDESSVGEDMKSSLWEQKTVKEKNEKGEEVEKTDYDWNAITKAVKSFISDYNKTVEQVGDSNDKNVLRNAAWMTKTTSLTENLLSRAGISITAGNKLELDEDELKNANISDLKSLFTGTNSYASKMFSKGTSISYAAAGAGGTYTSSGSYSSALSELVSGKIDTEK